MSGKRKPPKENFAAIQAGRDIVHRHSIFSYLYACANLNYPDNFPKDGFARISVKNHYDKTPIFTIELNPWQKTSAGEWAYAISQCYLHIALNHVDPVRNDEPWRFACELIAVDWLNQISIGQSIYSVTTTLPTQDPADIAYLLADDMTRARFDRGYPSPAGREQPTWIVHPEVKPFTATMRQSRTDTFASGIRNAVVEAVEKAGNQTRNKEGKPDSMAETARRWFVTNYPLLASLAAAFEIVEDADLCERLDISLAAVNTEIQRIYINPKFPWTSSYSNSQGC